MNQMRTHPIRITHIGGPTALIEIGQLRLLTDPTFDPAGSRYANGPVEVIKTTGPALTVSELGAVDAVLLSHDQGSWPHLGLTARLLPKRRGTHKKASLPKPPERLVLEGNFSEQTLCHSKQATCMPPKWP